MHKVLDNAEDSGENKNLTNHKPLNGVYSKKLLDDNLRNENFQKTFRVYEEKLLNSNDNLFFFPYFIFTFGLSRLFMFLLAQRFLYSWKTLYFC